MAKAVPHAKMPPEHCERKNQARRGSGGSKVESDDEEWWLGSSLQGFVFRREAS
jgi:hypothetical protein